jgi:hypothetical protein
VLIERPSGKPTSERRLIRPVLPIGQQDQRSHVDPVRAVGGEVGAYPLDLRRGCQAQCPPERLPANRLFEALLVEVQVRTPARHPATGIGDEHALDSHDTQ